MFASDRMKQYLWFAVAVLMLMDALGYTFGAIGPIRRAIGPAEPYWQKRLLLNLMLANEGMYFAAAIAFVGAVMKANRQPGADLLFALEAKRNRHQVYDFHAACKALGHLRKRRCIWRVATDTRSIDPPGESDFGGKQRQTSLAMPTWSRLPIMDGSWINAPKRGS